MSSPDILNLLPFPPLTIYLVTVLISYFSCLQYLQDTLHNFIVDLIDHKQDCEVHCQNTLKHYLTRLHIIVAEINISSILSFGFLNCVRLILPSCHLVQIWSTINKPSLNWCAELGTAF